MTMLQILTVLIKSKTGSILFYNTIIHIGTLSVSRCYRVLQVITQASDPGAAVTVSI